MWHGGILILIHVTRSVHTHRSGSDLFSLDFVMSALSLEIETALVI